MLFLKIALAIPLVALLVVSIVVTIGFLNRDRHDGGQDRTYSNAGTPIVLGWIVLFAGLYLYRWLY